MTLGEPRFAFPGCNTMHCLELARLALWVAAQAPTLARWRPATTADSIIAYWVAARQRFELWNHGLARLVDLEARGRSPAVEAWWDEHTPMVEEILVSETLTRVMAATGAAMDDGLEDWEVEPVTQSIYATHLECRNRVLRLLLTGHGYWGDQAMTLNRLRRGSERWTDFLLAPLVSVCPRAIDFAFDPLRVTAFAAAGSLGPIAPFGPLSSCGSDHSVISGDSVDSADSVAPWGSAPTTCSPLVATALQLTLGSLCQPRAALPQANWQLVQAVLACWPAELFDSLGVPLSLTAQRIRWSASLEQKPAVGSDPLAIAGRSGSQPVTVAGPQAGVPPPGLSRRWTY